MSASEGKVRREIAVTRSNGRGSAKQSPERIVEAIVAAIGEHRLAPGTKLGEEHLGEIFGVSRTIVRAALVRLANTRVVTIEPNRGAFVAQPSVREAREVFDARRVIETALIRRLAGVCDAAALAGLRRHLEQEDVARTAGDRRSAVKLSGDFHLKLAELAGNETLLELLRELVLRSSLVVMLYEYDGRTTCAPDEHTRLVAAIATGDVEGAARLMAEHLDHVEAGLSLDDKGGAAVDLREVFSAFTG